MKITAARSLGNMPVFDLSVQHDDHSFAHRSGVVLHNCAFVVSNDPIDTFIPLTTVGDVRVTSFTHAGVEAMGGLKMDFLVVNSIRDIGRAIKLIQSRHAPELRQKGHQRLNGIKVRNIQVVPLNGQFHDIWNLPADNAVYRDICTGKVETVFQFDAGAARQGLRQFRPVDDKLPLNSIEALSAFTALDRPGPLDARVKGMDGQEHNMLVEYARRARGEPPAGAMRILDEQLPETHGVITYQEQLQAIFQQVGGTTGIEANNFRQRISKKKLVDVNAKDRPLFMKGAMPLLGQEEADRLWNMMETFGQYGFNKSHAVCYVTISYACAFLKHHYPLEWWTAVLANADRNEVNEKFWRYISNIVLLPDIQASKPEFAIEGDHIRAPLWLVSGIGEKAQAQLAAMGKVTTVRELVEAIEKFKVDHPKTVSKTDAITGEVTVTQRKGLSPLSDALVKKLIVCGVLDSLFPATDADGLALTTTDRLRIFEETAAKVRGQRTYKGSATKFNLSSAISQYQYRKSLMPAYSEDLLPILRQETTGLFSVRPGKKNLLYKSGFVMVTGRQYEYLSALEILPPGALQVGLAAYVVAQRGFTYTNKKTGQRMDACELTFDVGGTRVAVVKWPGSNGLPADYYSDLTGSIGVATLERSDASKPFFLQSFDVLFAPLTPEKKEESSV